METIILISLCFMAAAYFKAHMDAIDDTGIKSSEWKNKYQLDEWDRPLFTHKKNHWWYFGLYKPRYAEKFPFSTTALVFLTDRWHSYQMFTYRFLYMGASFGYTKNLWTVFFLTFVVFPIVVGVIFEIFYGKAKSGYKIPKKKPKYEKIKKIDNVNEDNNNFSEEPYFGQVTSVPEKQINEQGL